MDMNLLFTEQLKYIALIIFWAVFCKLKCRPVKMKRFVMFPAANPGALGPAMCGH